MNGIVHCQQNHSMSHLVSTKNAYTILILNHTKSFLDSFLTSVFSDFNFCNLSLLSNELNNNDNDNNSKYKNL